MVFVREGTEGEYAGIGDRIFPGTEREVALQTAVFSRFGVERVIRWAFEFAVREGRSVTSVEQGQRPELLRPSCGTRSSMRSLPSTRWSPPRACWWTLQRCTWSMEPERFGVVVASNLFADILTDLGAALMGGMGFAPSANLNPGRVFPSMFEPIHGSAPDIAGKGMANPVGTIWSGAMMLEHLGHPEWAKSVLAAINETLGREEVRTPDMGGSSSTTEVGDAIVARLKPPVPLASLPQKGATARTADAH